MNDASIREFANRAGLETVWTDYAGRQHQVPLETVRHILSALRLPCFTTGEFASGQHSLDIAAELPRLITGVAGKPITLPTRQQGARQARLTLENGSSRDVDIVEVQDGLKILPIEVEGYHRLETNAEVITLAIAPSRCFTVADLAGSERLAGLSVQTYGLRSAHDCGIGDMAGVVALAKSAAALNVDALGLSPSHAMFTADPNHYSPYSPSNRLFYNPLLADPAMVLGEARVARARTTAALGLTARELESYPLINWPESSRSKLVVLRCLFDEFAANELAANSSGETLAQDFNHFREQRGASLNGHALFDALHEMHLQSNQMDGDWRRWSAEWRNPKSASVQRFAHRNGKAILFHSFLQWIADRSFALAQSHSRNAGMRIGFISDLAVGMSGSGSHAWMSQEEILGGVEIGAPPDLFNSAGQNWGLTTFSPSALGNNAFSPFIDTLRACMRHAGGVRIDHIMGMMHLWIVPQGAKASEGAYLTYPLTDLLRLIALESFRHRAIVIGEDLGTVPEGFRDTLAKAGIYGMSVLWFERDRDRFIPREKWPAAAVAMTSTHDLPTVAGWWRGSDLGTRAKHGLLSEKEIASRATDRKELWNAIKPDVPARSDPPAAEAGGRVTDAAVTFLAETPSRLALLPLEDGLALEDQPNLPGTIDQYPNWRRRYPGDADKLLADPAVARRVAALGARSTK